MKTKILDIKGKEKGSIDLPKAFSVPIREDIVSKVIEAKKTEQPYAPSPVAGRQHSASGIASHRRHVWKSQYGRGISRVPRKIFSRKGSQFNWEAAEVPFARGGRRAHPPKVLARINTLKINKKEFRIALESALAATANIKSLVKRYESIDDKTPKNVPYVVESKITTLKAKELISSVKNILGDLFNVAVQKKKIRTGKGKMRGRKYRKSAGLLIVVGKEEKLKTNAFDVANVNELNVADLAEGGLGRLTLYTEKAINELGAKK